MFCCLLACLSSKEREKEMISSCLGGEVERIWGVEGRESVIRIYCMNKFFQLREKKTTGHLEFIFLLEKQLANGIAFDK